MTEDEARMRIILSMCPDRVCRTCGEPSRRIVEESAAYLSVKKNWISSADHPHRNMKAGDGQAPPELRSKGRGGLIRQVDTIGWTDCGHDDWRPGVVLDPFADQVGEPR